MHAPADLRTDLVVSKRTGDSTTIENSFPKQPKKLSDKSCCVLKYLEMREDVMVE